jgi:hypothetical protein
MHVEYGYVRDSSTLMSLVCRERKKKKMIVVIYFKTLKINKDT